MTTSHVWDRAAVPIVRDGRRLPEVAALPAGSGLPTLDELFDFMRDAELRFATLRLRVVETVRSARGEESLRSDVLLRHAGDARVTTSRPGDVLGTDYEVWISDGDLVRTYSAAHKLGTQRPVRNRPRGLDDRDFPGSAKVYEPVTALPYETIPDTFVHPGGYCQNVLATGRCHLAGTEQLVGREVILLGCDHPRTTEIAGDRPDFHIDLAIDRATGMILRLVETIGGEVTRLAEVTAIGTDAPLPPGAFEFAFPTGTTMLY
ncbi:MAG TPA: hypothetical protein VD763_11770 [Candidatus Saccharimonadales bacterium]|nr:hypothetical protein [Candidatus Saccharimonadales bacterium]